MRRNKLLQYNYVILEMSQMQKYEIEIKKKEECNTAFRSITKKKKK